MFRNVLKRRNQRLVRSCSALALGAGLTAAGWGQADVSPNTAPGKGVVSTANRERAEKAFLTGARLLDGADLEGAQAEFTRAATLDPARADYSMAVTVTREHRVSELVQKAAKARMLGAAGGGERQAEALLAQAKAIDPNDERILEHALDGESLRATAPRASITSNSAQAAKNAVFAPPIHVAPDPGPKDVDLRGDAISVITSTAQVYGLKAVFDSADSGEALPPIRFQMDASPYERTMPTLLKMTHRFSVPLNAKTLLIARDTPENRARLERQVEETIYVPGSTPEQLNELTNIIKNVFDVKQVAITASSGTMAVRAPESTLSALNETVADLIDGETEVMLELKLVSVAKTATVNTGLQTPTSVGAFNAYSEAASLVSANQTLVTALISSANYVPTGNNFKDTIAEALLLLLSGAVTDAKFSGIFAVFGGGVAGLTGVYLGSGVTFNLGLANSDTQALDDVTVRVGDRQTTTLKLGEKYPIVTATYASGISASTRSALAGVSINGQPASSLLNQYLGSAANQTIPQVQYQDLGLTVKATPTVLKSGLVDMKIELKLDALTGGNLNNIPVLSSEDFLSDIAVPDGSTAVMLSNLSRTESASISGLPGLSELPGFQESAADDLRERNSSELVLLVTPHVVMHRKDLTASRRIPFETSVPQEF